MMRCMLLAAMVGGAVGGDSVCPKDCCKNCLMTNRKYCFDQVSLPGFSFVVSGDIAQPVTPTYTVHGKLLGVKTAETPTTGQACGSVQVEIEGGTIGNINVDFSNGGKQSCPFQPGTVTVPGSVGVTINPPMGKFIQHFETNSESGQMIMCVDVTVGGCTPPAQPAGCAAPGPAPAPPAPFPPTPSGYRCNAATNACEMAAGGVDISICQAACGGPAPSPPSGTLYKCSATQTCEAAAAGIDIATCQAMCKPAPTPPTPPAPVPPPPPTPASTFKCESETGTCVAAAAGLDKASCLLLCPQPTFACNNETGQCEATQAGGSDKASCEQSCAPAQPYTCIAKQCVKADKGLSLKRCQQACE